jgi:Mce-associated membrane protein
MSPRRMVDAGSTDLFRMPESQPRRRGLAIAGAIAAVAIITAVAISAIIFATQESSRRQQIREAAVRDFVRTFVTQYTSPDPFNANAYAEKVLALAPATSPSCTPTG